MVARVAARTFIVRISESPRRVVVEDVRTRRRVVAPGVDEVGRSIGVLLSEPDEGTIVVPLEGDRPTTHPPGSP
jgi:hypothetical protein